MPIELAHLKGWESWVVYPDCTVGKNRFQSKSAKCAEFFAFAQGANTITAIIVPISGIFG
jgi:hypothetical protein